MDSARTYSQDVELGPVRQGEDAHGFALADARVVEAPQLGPLIARVPAVRGRAVREDALLGAALLLVAPRAAERRVEAAPVEGLAQRLRLHHLGVDLAARRDGRNAARQAFFVDMDAQVEPEAARRLVAEGDHLAEFPGGVDVQQRKGKRRGMERLQRDMQHRAGVLADGI